MTTTRALAALDRRIRGLDAARGLALLGMLYAHAIPDGRTETVFDGRSSILFATIAGVSLGLMSGGERRLARGHRGRVAVSIAIRALLLIALGVGLTLLDTPLAIILDTYGFLFLVMLPLLFAPWIVAAVVGVLAVVAGPILVEALMRLHGDPSSAFGAATRDWAYFPYEWIAGHYPALVWIAYLVIGLLIARAGVLRRRTQIALVAGGGAVTLVVYVGAALLGDPVREHTNTTWEALAGGGLAAAVIGLLTWLLDVTPARMRTVLGWVTYPLRAAGSMPVTLYTGQVVAIALVIATGAAPAGFLAWQSVPLFATLLLASLAFASLWHILFEQGPLEWIMARLARRRPWRRERLTPASRPE
ncbi:DUF418 domain-containing protein [Cnuibacter sp. UC19_7]|uniref:DUF418 domain-containing protein n=1 Tax=Cnuibacter sp. UC19_7 TaxID=3350166 RepID=UPI00367196F4